MLRRWSLIVAFALALAGCARELVDTPHVMVGEAGRRVYAMTPERLRTPEIPILYVTDRAVRETSERGPEYGHGRASDLSYGVATVSLNPGPTWDELVEASTTEDRERTYHPRVTKVEELGKFANTSTRLEAVNGRLARKKDAMASLEAEQRAFHEALTPWLNAAEHKEAVVFIHGYNNKFDDAALRHAQAWHAAGRMGVPIVYTWPAGSGGLKGYAYDRESGEYTIVHLKLMLLALAKHPGIEKIHIISHSRGTDVAVTALRELNAEVRAALGGGAVSINLFGEDPVSALPGRAGREVHDVLKLETLILAAPDLDLDVFAQRFFGENLLRAANRTIIYFSEKDGALGTADWLFRSRRRLGALHISDLRPEVRAIFAALPSLEAINCKVTGYTSHSYILQHPATLSDVILALRDGAAAGSAARPLARAAEGIWELDDNYLKPGRAPGAPSRSSRGAPSPDDN